MSDGVTCVINAGSLHHFIRRSQRIVAWLWSSSSVGLEMAIPSPWVKQFISDSLFNQNSKSRPSNINDDGFHQRSLRASFRGRCLSVHISRRLSSAYVEARARRPQRKCALLCSALLCVRVCVSQSQHQHRSGRLSASSLFRRLCNHSTAADRSPRAVA